MSTTVTYLTIHIRCRAHMHCLWGSQCCKEADAKHVIFDSSLA
uniref:Uncharacterized protein n=1 Tax=Triticum urartu TaxID=4572 RepID=A0A8R7QSP4_TRIUA